MRGVQTLVIGLVVLSAVTLFMAAIVEPIAAVALDSEAVQDLGWASDVESIQETLLRYVPLMWIAFLLTWVGMWAFRRGRTTEVRRA